MVCNSVTDREAWDLRAFLYTTEFKEDISNNGNCIKWVKPRLRDPDNGHITSNWCQIFKIVGRRIDNFDINLTKEKNIRFVLFCSNSKLWFVFTFSAHLKIWNTTDPLAWTELEPNWDPNMNDHIYGCFPWLAFNLLTHRYSI